MKVKEGSKKVGLKLNIQKIKIVASGLITSWEIDGGNNGNSYRIYFLGLQKSLQNGDCNHEIIRRLLLEGGGSYDKPEHHIKSRDFTLPKKVCLVKAIVFPVVM